MEEIFELENAIDEYVEKCIEEYNFLLRVHDEGIRDCIVPEGGDVRKDGKPYHPTKLSTAPFDPDVSLLLYVTEKTKQMRDAKAKMAEKVKETETEDPELAKIRQQKMNKLMKDK